MVTDRDVRTLIGDPLTALCDGPCGPAADLTVEDAMSQNPATAYIDDPLSTLSWSLVDERLGAVPVLDDQRRVVGIVSYVDVLQAALAR
jgi:CBS-domain-containing membrane protein